MENADIFTPSNIFKAYIACRKGKGTLAAVERVEHNMRSISQNGKKRAYFMQLDIKNFFMSIDREILWKLLEKGLKKQFRIRKGSEDSIQTTIFDVGSDEEGFKKMSKIVRTLLFHDPTGNFVNKSTKREWSWVPQEKSLFNAGDGKGLPIGNLTSQFFANVYLNELDQFIKHVLKIKYYVRYVDDFVIMHEDREQLRVWLCKIKEFLAEKLKVTLKNEVKVAPLSNGINFLGYVQHIFYRLVRRRVVNNFRNKLRWWEKEIKTAAESGETPYYDVSGKMPAQERRHGMTSLQKINEIGMLQKLGAVITSYLAYSSKVNSFHIVIKTLHPHQWLKELFRLFKTKAAPLDGIRFEHKVSINSFYWR